MGDGMPYMKFGMEPLNDISENILKGNLRYADTIIVGDNSSGKSLLLRLLLDKMGEIDEVYFIDAVNRGFDVSKVIEENQKLSYNKAIVKTRIQENYFNLEDSFNCYGTLTERIEQIYYLFEDELQELFCELTGERFKIAGNGILGEVDFENGRGTLSSGYQAIVRIILELLFYQQKCIVDKQLSRVKVIIDELDEFLSPTYARKIFPFLKKKFCQMDFVITTHSCDVVVASQNANLVILDNSEVEVVDVNDYQSASEVQMIFNRIFGEYSVPVSETEQLLRRLLNNRINKAWSSHDQMQMEELQTQSLTASQQLILKQILEW